ncbi:ATP-binding protein [Streptomyces sp. LARHCF249]
MSRRVAVLDLAHRLEILGQNVRRALAARRALDPSPDDPHLGLYLSADAADRLLDRPAAAESAAPADDPGAAPGAAPAPGTPCLPEGLPLSRLAAHFALDALDVELLLVALLPDVDQRFEKLYGYLNDDLTRRRAGAALAFELLGLSPLDADARRRLSPGSALVDGGLLEVEEPERPFLSRSLLVPDRIVAHLLGDDTPDACLHGLLSLSAESSSASVPVLGAERLAGTLKSGVRLAYLRERPGGSAAATAVAALGAAGMPACRLDLTVLAACPHPERLLQAAAREARLRGGGLVAGPAEALTQPLLRELTRLPVPVLVTGSGGWDPQWSDRTPLITDAEPFATDERAARFRTALEGAGLAPDLDLAAAVAPYHLTPDQVGRAAAGACAQALLDGPGTPVAARHVRSGVRAQNAAGLERLARRIEPAVGWSDLVLPDATRQELAELALRARHRDRVLGGWRMRPGGGRGRGVIALFAGDSGTGKTMSAEVVAGELGLDLYVVELSTVVDKFVGETEKNLERIFTEAAGVNGILLFDEADAVFGKRSEVKDAHDRYANMESAYLLQRMESFDGIAVLTTNLRANLDEAFTRRLDVIVDFPVPEADQRRALWDRCLGTELPRADDLDLASCARFELAGGSIRACAVTAAYLAAEAGRPLTTADLATAVRREYRKLGRLVLPEEFGAWAR